MLFLVSAQLRQGDVDDSGARAAAAIPLTSANTVLVLGSDTRTKATAEPGASTSGQRAQPTRSC